MGSARTQAQASGAPAPERRISRADVVVSLALFAANLLVVGRYALTGFSNQTWNNEYNYLSVAQLFRSHPFSWNSLWYAGLPFTFAYPPLFHALVALTPVSLGSAFHLVAAVTYALTPVAIYALALRLLESRFAAGVAALTYTLLPSPIYLLPAWRADAARFFYAPYSFVAAVGYAAAPNLFGLLLTLVCVALFWQRRWTLAALAFGAVALTHWSSAVGAAFILFAATVGLTRVLGFRVAAVRFISTLAIGYGISAFWLTAGYLRASQVGARVLAYGDYPPNPWGLATWLLLFAGLGLIGVSLWPRVPARWAFLLAWLGVVGAPIAAFQIDGSHLIPHAWRLGLELNVGLTLAFAGLVTLGRWFRVAGVVAVVALAIVAVPFVRNSRRLQPEPLRSNDFAPSIAAKITSLSQHDRVFVAGELTQSLNTFSPTPQLGGPVDQAGANPLVLAAQRQVMYGCDPDSARVAELWLQALGCRYVVVHGSSSRETYHWFVQPGRFQGMEQEWSNGEGDNIYRVPGWQPGTAVVVDLTALASVSGPLSTSDTRFLESYVSWAHGLRPARVLWQSSGAAEVETPLEAGEGVLVKINAEAGWRANGAHAESDPIGFLLLRPDEGARKASGEISFSRHFTPDEWLGFLVTAAVIGLLLLRRHGIAAAVAVLPLLFLVAGFGQAKPAAGLVGHAEHAFQALQPPLIAPGGVVLARPNPGAPATITIYGRNFGKAQDRTALWIGGQQAKVVSHSATVINAEWQGAGGPADVSVEVNACRGNAYRIAIP